MAGQRRRQRHRDGAGGFRRLALLALGALTLACAGEPGQLYGPDRPGTGGGTALPSELVGDWEVVILISAGGDLQTWTTVWSFRADGTCQYRQSVYSVLEDLERVTVRPCTWSAANARITVIFTDEAGGSVVMPYAFPFLDGMRLVLEGIEYRRRT